MEWLLIPAFGVLIWLLQRSVQQEQALSTLAKRLKSTEELATYQAERAAKEVERLRTQDGHRAQRLAGRCGADVAGRLSAALNRRAGRRRRRRRRRSAHRR